MPSRELSPHVGRAADERPCLNDKADFVLFQQHQRLDQVEYVLVDSHEVRYVVGRRVAAHCLVVWEDEAVIEGRFLGLDAIQGFQKFVTRGGVPLTVTDDDQGWKKDIFGR